MLFISTGVVAAVGETAAVFTSPVAAASVGRGLTSGAKTAAWGWGGLTTCTGAVAWADAVTAGAVTGIIGAAGLAVVTAGTVRVAGVVCGCATGAAAGFAAATGFTG